VIGQGVWILWGVENCHLPLTKPVAVNTGLALPHSPWFIGMYYGLMDWQCSVSVSIFRFSIYVFVLMHRSFLQAGCPSCRPTNSVKALKAPHWAVGCWHGYLSGARCRLAYGPADATAAHCLLTHQKEPLDIELSTRQTWVWFTGGNKITSIQSYSSRSPETLNREVHGTKSIFL